LIFILVDIHPAAANMWNRSQNNRGYCGGSPTTVRPSDPALCGSRPL